MRLYHLYAAELVSSLLKIVASHIVVHSHHSAHTPHSSHAAHSTHTAHASHSPHATIPPGGIAGIGAAFFGFSVIAASVVINSEATLAAFSSADAPPSPDRLRPP